MIQFMDHQKDGLAFLEKRKTGALFYEMGLGKTLIMLEHLNRIKQFPALIVCPLSVTSVWRREAEKFGYNLKIVELTGSRKKRFELLQEWADIYVINYEGLRVIPKDLKEKGFQCIVLDESHRIKDNSTEQTEVALDLASEIPYRYILTGTPVTKSPEDIWSQIEFVQPSHLGTFWGFRNAYIQFRKIEVRTRNGFKTINKACRFKDLNKLNEKLQPVSLRKTKKECLDLPDKIYKKIDCPLTPEQRKVYADIRDKLKEQVDTKTVDVSALSATLQKLQQVCQGFYYDENGDANYLKSGKINILKDIVEDLNNEKLVILTWYKADIDRLQKELSKKRRVLVYDGKPEERAAIEKDFQESDDDCVFLSNIEKCKEGITLTSSCHVIFYGNSYNYGSRAQVEDRIHRKGQTRTCIYWDLVVPNTVEERIKIALTQKKKTADVVTGDAMRLAMLELESKI